MPFAGRRHQRLPHPVAAADPALRPRTVRHHGAHLWRRRGQESSADSGQTLLNDPANREWIRGVIASGNTNFGEAYCAAGDIIAAKCKVPYLYRYELMGTPEDTAAVRNGLVRFFTEQ
mgnify:CR=1 FL=1